MRPPIALTLFLLAACHSAPTPAVAEGQGKGLIAFDPAPPQGAKVWPQAEWHKGDRYILVRGGQEKMLFTVSEVSDQGYVLVDAAGNQYLRGKDLANLGEKPRGAERLVHELAPGDVRFHWPLSASDGDVIISTRAQMGPCCPSKPPTWSKTWTRLQCPAGPSRR
jgi:hypothetical protein